MSTYESGREIGSSCFKLCKRNHKGELLSYFLDKIDLDEFHILKRSSLFRVISQEELLEEKWAGYIFFKKSEYELEHINLWIEFLKKSKISVNFVNKPFPQFDPNDKIEEIRIIN